MKRLSLAFALVFGLLPAAGGQPTQHASAELFHRQTGDEIRAAIRIRIDPGYHLYHPDLGHPDAVGMPTVLTMGGEDIQWSSPRFPQPERYDQSSIAPNGAFILGHEGTLVVYVAGRLAEGAEVGEVTLAKIDGLTCEDNGSCVPYRQTSLESKGAGPDAIFEAFPADLSAPGGEEAGDEEAEPRPVPTQSGRAKATVYARKVGDSQAQIAIDIDIDEGFHLYHDELGHPDAIGQPTQVRLRGKGLTFSEPAFPEPERYDQSSLTPGAFIYGHEDRVIIHALARMAQGASLDDLSVDIDGLTCEDNGSCVPYQARNLVAEPSAPQGVFATFPKSLDVSAADEAEASGAEPGNEDAPADEPAQTLKPPGPPSQKGEARATVYSRRSDVEVRLAIEIEIDPRYHLYHDELGHPDAIGQPTRIVLQGHGIRWSQPQFPEPERYDQSDIEPGLFILGHEGTLVVHARGEVAADAGSGSVWVDIDGLTCEDDGSCIPYEAKNLVPEGPGPDALFASFPPGLEVPEAGGRSGSAEGGTARNEMASPRVREAREWTEAELAGVELGDYSVRNDEGADRSLLMWMAFAFIAGIILNVMPCVLPVISLKVLSLVSQAGESRGRMLAHGLVYSGGILSVFLVLAGFAAFANQGWGEQFQSQTFLVIMIGFIFAFALSLLGVFEIGVPQKVGEMAGIKREGFKDAFFKGIMTTILATPCSGPFLGATLAWAVAQDQVTIFSVFTMVGLGMAAPYMLLVSHPAFLRFVPKPGAWMETFKQAMGFVLMATVVFLMISLSQDLLLFTVAFLIFVGLGAWIWGRFAHFGQNRVRHLATLAMALLVVAAGGHISYRWLPELLGQGEAQAATADRVVWEPFDPVRLAQYHEEGRSVLIDFTADWCLTCKTNEAFVYHTEEVEEVLLRKNVACMIADLTHDTPLALKAKELMAKLGSYSIPFLAIFPGDDPLAPYTLRDLVTKSQVLEILESLPDPQLPAR